MNDNNFIGLNPELARKNIDNFNRNVNDAYAYMKKNLDLLFNELYKNWYSPNALVFAKTVNNLLDDFRIELRENISRINNNAQEAFNILARANGIDTIEYYNGFFQNDVIRYELLEIGDDGTVGMNVQEVISCVSIFKNKMRDVITIFASLPNSIELYDEENGQKNYYSTSIRKLEGIVDNILTSIINKIDENIEMEITRIEKAKIDAQNILNNL